MHVHFFSSQVYSEIYFQVTLDDLSVNAKPRFVVCHASTPGILPVQWCLKNGMGLERPRGYEGQDFDWADYLKHSGTEAAPDACFPDVSTVFVFICPGSLTRAFLFLTAEVKFLFILRKRD